MDNSGRYIDHCRIFMSKSGMRLQREKIWGLVFSWIRPLSSKKIDRGVFGITKLKTIERKTFINMLLGEKGDRLRDAGSAKLGFQLEQVERKYGYIELDYQWIKIMKMTIFTLSLKF